MNALALVPEPALRCSFGIAFAREPSPVVFVAIFATAHRPVRFAGPSGFVANPARFAAFAPQNDVGASLMNRVAQVRNVVVSASIRNVAVATFATIVARTATCAVEPHFKLVGAILCNLGALFKEHFVRIGRSVVSVLILFAPIGTVAVPGRNVEAILHVQLFGSSRKVARNVRLLGIRI